MPARDNGTGLIYRINRHPVDSSIGFPNTYHWIEIHPMDSAQSAPEELQLPVFLREKDIVHNISRT